MPIYEYICNKCHNNYALLQKVDASENESACPQCGSVDVKKIPSAFSCSWPDGSGSSSGGSMPGGFSGGG